MTERKRFYNVLVYVAAGLLVGVAAMDGQGSGTGSALGAEADQADALLARIATYTYGGDREPLTQLTELERSLGQDKAALRALEQKYIAFLQSEASAAGKQFICRRLSIFGSEASAPVLAGMLQDPQTADMARYALELIPGTAVDAALREAVDGADTKVKVGILSTLGLRGDPASVPVLSRYVTDADTDVAAAAITGLGQIGSAEAIAALSEAKDKTTGDLQMMVLDAILNCADKLDMDGQTGTALKLYREVFESDVPAVIRSAALRGMVFCSPEKAGPILVEVIRKGDPALTSVAVGLLNEVKDDADLAAIAAEVKNQPPAGQVQLLTALGNRGHKAAAKAVIEAAASSHPEVRIAAYKALISLGGAEAVPLLAKVAAASRGAERQAARDALYALRADGVDEAIVSAIEGMAGDDQAGTRAELIRAIGERNIKAGVPTLLKAVTDPQVKVRMEAWKVLRELAGAEHLGVMLDALVAITSVTERMYAERAVAAAGQKAGAEAAVEAFVGRLNDAPATGRASLLRLLGQLGGPKAFEAVRGALKDGDPAVVDAAIRSLAKFPDALPAVVLLDLAKTAETPVRRILALRGYVRMIDLVQTSTADRVQMCRTAMGLADRAAEKRLVLAAAARIPDAKAKAFVLQYASDPQVEAEAKAAAAQIDERLGQVVTVRDAGTLSADKVRIVGAGAKLDDAKAHVVGWNDTSTTLQWETVFEQAGTYEVVVVQAASAPDGDVVAVVIGSKTIEGRARDTKGAYEPVRLGTMKIDRPGVYKVVLQAKTQTGEAIMNVEAIRLERQRETGSRVVLTGSDFSAWRDRIGTWMIGGDAAPDPDDPKRLRCEPGNGVFVNGPDGRTVYLFSKAEFGDCVAHIEFMVPKGSNSGVYFQGRYEVQIFDSYGVASPKYSDCGGIYERWKDGRGYEGVGPRVNASLPPGQWQSFDVVFRAPRFDASGRKLANARFVKVVHNGKVIHENVEVTGPTRAAQFGDEKPTGPLVLQGDHGPVAYRNIWIAPVN